MQNILLEILRKGLSGDLRNNQIAIYLYDKLQSMIELPDKTQLGTILKSAVSETSNTANLPQNSFPEFRDLRVSRMLLKGVRNFPANGNTYYALSFGKEQPTSTVFLGKNGVGKSSLFSAFEYSCSGTCQAYQHRIGDNSSKPTEYLANIYSNTPDCVIITEHPNFQNKTVLDESNETDQNKQEKETEKETEKQTLVPLAFFCSDYDVIKISKDFGTSYILQQLQLDDFYQLLIRLRSLINENQKVSTKYRNLKRSYYESQLKTEIWTNLLSIDKQNVQELTLLNSGIKQILSSSDKNQIFQPMNHEWVKWCEKILSILLQGKEDDKIQAQFPQLYILTGNIQQIKRSIQNNQELSQDNAKLYLDKLEILSSEIWSWNELQIYFSEQEIQLQIQDIIRKYNLNSSDYIDDYKKLSETYPLVSIDKSHRQLIIQIQQHLDQEYQAILTKLKDSITIVLDHLFTSYYKNDIEGFTTESIDDKLSIMINPRITVQTDSQKTSKPISPQDFLNTFRFKLYCVALKLALSETCKKLYNLNFPFVMDDVFDSSDFENRLRIKAFTTHILEAHQELITKNLVPDSPLQLIFFTQDDIIGECVVKGIKEFEYTTPVQFSRLFKINEVQELDITTEKHSDLDIIVINIVDPIN